MKSFLDGKIHVHAGDCLDVLKTLADSSVDSCVTDPPYALVSIVKRFGSENAAPAKSDGASGVYKRASSGFMGKQWDTGERAFSTEFWSEVYRVLKPGGHVLAFAGTRTYHRLACAIEDAGFEVRDQIGWAFGSGFPKSHDVSKGIDARAGVQLGWFGSWLKGWREKQGISQIELARHFPSKSGGATGRVSNWELGVRLPTIDDFNLLCRVLDLPFKTLAEVEREVIGTKAGDPERFRRFVEQDGNERSTFSSDITAPSTPEAIKWQGWGTALKPAWEPICMARKPLGESTVAGNVLKWGTGGINIDGCRVATDDNLNGGAYAKDATARDQMWGDEAGNSWRRGGAGEYKAPPGRWPANLLHDGSDEVVGAFPETSSVTGKRSERSQNASVTGTTWLSDNHKSVEHTDSGSPARFFYSAKADSDDRLGSKHPTVKPVDLMQYLVRLVTPKGGTVLDPFAGTGTTGEAAVREGCRAVLIEREPEYLADIERRCGLILAGPDTRLHATIKAKGKVEDAGPLFGGARTLSQNPSSASLTESSPASPAAYRGDAA